MKICAVTGTEMRKENAVELSGEYVLKPELAESEEDKKEIEAHIEAQQKGADEE